MDARKILQIKKHTFIAPPARNTGAANVGMNL